MEVWVATRMLLLLYRHTYIHVSAIYKPLLANEINHTLTRSVFNAPETVLIRYQANVKEEHHSALSSLGPTKVRVSVSKSNYFWKGSVDN
ncbi:hypothetical protein HanRHA438_Chr06g0250611 [Helianthus annuus]|nr:hypothetical protein HanRHA438_Chr06g0250611 [Helianthus annuus]